MQRAGIDFVNHELALLVQYNPPPRSPDPEASHMYLKLTPPLTFYDKHLDAKLTLKRIEVLPLATYISQALNHTSQSIKEKKIPLPTHRPGDSFSSQQFRADDEDKRRPLMIDARNLAEIYQDTTAGYSGVVASPLLFHVRAPGWYSALIWRAVSGQNLGRLHAFSEDYALQIRNLDNVPRNVQDFMDEETRATLQRVQHRYDGLAYWEIFAISREAEDVLKEMDEVASVQPFIYETCQTTGFPAPPVFQVRPPDASITSWGVSLNASLESSAQQETTTPRESAAEQGLPSPKEEPPRMRTRSRKSETVPMGSPKKKSKSSKKDTEPPNGTIYTWPSVTIPVRSDKKSMAKLFIQRAWAQAVEHDTTYIVFHCGNFERIGFRHRSTQTLFLSNLIDVPHCKNPGYTKIHIGLYLSIMQDVIDRMEQQRKQDEPPRPNIRKRPQRHVVLSSSKRHRTTAMVLQEQREEKERRINDEIVKTEGVKRFLALVELRYGVYNSPAPASFVRVHHIRKKAYSPDEYFSLVLTSQIAAGATGVAHGARLELLASDGQVRRLNAVVKVSFEPDQIQRLRHEFSIYEHLVSCGVVESIPVIYGLFEDVETDAIALVMSDVGTCLWTLRTDKQNVDVTVFESAKAAYLRVLRTIHAAGVRHHDFRPENLMLTDEIKVAIIDFDMAELNPSEGSKRREMRHMTDLLNGSYCPPNEIPSAATTPERPGPAVNNMSRTRLQSVDEDGDEGEQNAPTVLASLFSVDK